MKLSLVFAAYTKYSQPEKSVAVVVIVAGAMSDSINAGAVLMLRDRSGDALVPELGAEVAPHRVVLGVAARLRHRAAGAAIND